MYSKRKLQMGVAALMAIAGCSDRMDSPVGPVAPGASPMGVGVGTGNPGDQGTVTITRTTDVRPPGGAGLPAGAPSNVVHRKQSFEMGTARVTVRSEDVRLLMALRAKAAASPTSLADLPVSGLSVPAGAQSLRDANNPWRRTAPVAGEPGGLVESNGTGDAPASTIRYMRNGDVVMVIEQQWELWKRQWNLVRRETRMTDGSLHDVIDVSRAGRSGLALQSPREWAPARLPVGGASAAFDIYGEEYEVCDACRTLRKNAEEALVNSLIKDGLAVAACAWAPLGVTLPVCAAALGVMAEALVKVLRAASDLMDCEASPPPCPKKISTTDCTVRSAGGRQLRPSFDCGATTGDGGTGSGSGTASSAGHWQCTYYYEYDLHTGNVLFAQLLYCAWHDGP